MLSIITFENTYKHLAMAAQMALHRPDRPERYLRFLANAAAVGLRISEHEEFRMEAVNQSGNGPKTFVELQVELLSQGPRRHALPLLICALMIAGIAAPHVKGQWVLVWVAGHVSILIIRWRILSGLQRRTRTPIENRLGYATWLMLVSGLSHGLSLLFFPYLPPFERALHSLVLMCIAASGASMCAGHRPILYAFIVPTIGPLALLWLLTDELRNTGVIPGLMGFLMVLSVIVLDAMARDTARILRDSFKIRLDLRKALDDAEAASRSKTRFLASASHDLRQPIQAALLFSGALKRQSLDLDSLYLANNIDDALCDLSGELNSLLDISKLDAGVVSTSIKTVDLTAVVLRIERLFARAASAKHLTIEARMPANAYVRTDRLILERILRNLVDNAVKYTDAGVIRISVVAQADNYIVNVVDSGPGISEAEQLAIFEEFYQINNPGRDRRRGLGLGLAIVKRLAELLNTRVMLQSMEGAGSTFSIALPAMLHVVEEVAAPSALDAPTFALTDVLVVDDEEGVRLGMKALLERFGCNVRLAIGTADALDSVRSSCPDLMITDFRLGGQDNGVRTIILAREQHPQLLAILMTGETAPERLREAYAAGIAVVHKPVTPDILREALCQVCLAAVPTDAEVA